MAELEPKPINLTVTCPRCGKSETKTVEIPEENVMAAQLKFVWEFAQGHRH